MDLRGLRESLERRVNSTAVERSLLDLVRGRGVEEEEREPVDLEVGAVLGVEADAEEAFFCLAEERMMERMF